MESVGNSGLRFVPRDVQEKFVETVKHQVINSAIADVVSSLQNPPGRLGSSEERACSDWYNNLTDADVAHVNNIISS